MHLCDKGGCRKLLGHKGKCDRYPKEPFSFLLKKDKNKLDKAGYATPRGGKKGAYQNHVYRHSRVIVPYERLGKAPLSKYEEGYTVRLLPEQCFKASGLVKEEVALDSRFELGENAFVLYRSHISLQEYPPLNGWTVRHLENADGQIVDRRGKLVVDKGHYVLRLPASGGSGRVSKKERIEGPPQGIFAPEYSNKDTDYLSKIALAWQMVHTVDSPYTTDQARHIELLLDTINQKKYSFYQFKGMMRATFACCPLCTRPLYHRELHETINLDEENGLLNAGAQVLGTTRSTVVNLFHMHPLVYEDLEHIPSNVAWGHASCNTKLGQRRCYSLAELQELNLKAAIVAGEAVHTFGWASEDRRFIRSPSGAVWIQITENTPLESYAWLGDS